jgi:hypothetical protein
VIEQRRGVVWARAGFRVPWKLNAALIGAVNALHRVVKQGFVRDAQFGGRLFSSTAKPWFCAVIITTVVIQIFYRVVAAVVANFIFTVFAPLARASNWWPRQMPNTGISVVRNCLIAAMA